MRSLPAFALAALLLAGCHFHRDDRGFSPWPTDFNRNGYGAVLLGAPLEDAGGADRGRVYLYEGSFSPDATADMIYSGTEDGGQFGFSVAAIGDFNGDAYPDFAVGAPLEDAGGTDRGNVYIYFGGIGLPSIPSVTLSGTEDLGQFGFALARAGDVNGDGRDELLVGAPFESGGGTTRGRAYLFTSSSTSPLLTFSGGEDLGLFGASVDTAGDMNRDGFFDIAIGAPMDDADGNTADNAVDRGRAFVYFGSAFPDNSVDRVFDGPEDGGRFGAAVAGLLDYNDDGYGDLAVGSPFDDGDGNTVEDGLNRGRAFIFYGSSSPDTIADRTLTGAEDGGRFGAMVARIGDINSGGAPDVLVGAPFDDGDGNTTDGGADRGRAFVFFGGPLNDTVADLTFTGSEDGSRFGASGFSGGDVGSGGARDLVIGAPLDDGDGNATENGIDAGRAFVFFGGSGMDNVSDLTLLGGAEAGAEAGTAVQ